jgi:hypothetical protein
MYLIKIYIILDRWDYKMILKSINGKDILVDEASLPLLNKYKWVVPLSGYAYAATSSGKPNFSICMHRLITNCPIGLTVDHLNKNRLDNRLENLEIVTRGENSRRAHKKPEREKPINVNVYLKGREYTDFIRDEAERLGISHREFILNFLKENIKTHLTK